MRYFESHETIYARRLAAGAEGWDDGNYDEFALRDVVANWLATSRVAEAGAKILELGCGTGALSCMLAQRGFSVLGIDVSPSAISFARSVASLRALTVDFLVADACSLPVLIQSFDVIIDAHLLHCISLPAERKHLLSLIAMSLQPSGEFWTETMALHPEFKNSPLRQIDPAGVVWSAIDDPTRCSDAVLRDGSWWIPMRYIAGSAEALIAEFAAAGLCPLEWNLVPPARLGEPADFRGRFRRCSGAGQDALHADSLLQAQRQAQPGQSAEGKP